MEEDHQSSLGDDREIHPLDAVSEDQPTHHTCYRCGNHPEGNQRKDRRPEGLPEEGKLGDAIVLEELGNAIATRQALGVEHQVHGHGVAPQRKEDALPQAQQTGVPPDQVDRQRRDRQREVAAEEVEPEVVKRRRKNEQGDRQQNPGDESLEKFHRLGSWSGDGTGICGGLT